MKPFLDTDTDMSDEEGLPPPPPDSDGEGTEEAPRASEVDDVVGDEEGTPRRQ